MSLAVKAARQQVAGDPGLFGSIGKFLGGGLKTIGGIIGGPVGFGLKTIGGFAGGGPQIQPPAPRTTRLQRGSFAGGGTRGMFGGVAAEARAAGQRQITGEVGISCPQGMRPNKSAYFLRDGTFVGKGSRCVAYRKRNPANARANDRAIGRIESAKKMAARLGRITIRKECPHK